MIILKEIYEDLSVESGDIQLYEDLTVSLADSAGLYLGSADEQLGSADEQYKATPANILIDEVRGGVKKSGTFGWWGPLGPHHPVCSTLSWVGSLVVSDYVL